VYARLPQALLQAGPLRRVAEAQAHQVFKRLRLIGSARVNPGALRQVGQPLARGVQGGALGRVVRLLFLLVVSHALPPHVASRPRRAARSGEGAAR
jgi:hypothetical protein